MMSSEKTDNCYVVQAEDGDVAVMLSCDGFDKDSPMRLNLGETTMTMQQNGNDVLECPLPEAWAVEALRTAPRIIAVNVSAPGRPDEAYAINESVHLVGAA